LNIGKLRREPIGQSLHGEAFAGEVAGEHERDSLGFGFEAGVKISFTREERIATGNSGRFKQRAAAAARDAEPVDLLLVISNDAQSVDVKKLLHAFR
jgi:hypothetical protein